jgi:hypothetical protein
MMSAIFGRDQKCRTFGANASLNAYHALTGVAINFRPIRACSDIAFWVLTFQMF